MVFIFKWQFLVYLVLFSYLATLSGQLYFRRKVTSSHFFRVTISALPVFVRSSYFSEQLLLLRSSVSGIVTSSQQLFFQNIYFLEAKLLPSNHFLRIGSSLGQLLLAHFRITFSKKLIFQIKNILYTYFSWRTTFLERLLFQKTLPFIAATFSEELRSDIITFQRSCYFTATLTLHSYTYYLSVSN